MEEPILKPGLSHSVREITRIIRLSFREAIPKTRATNYAGFKTTGLSVLLIRCILCFAKYRVPYSVNEYILYRNSFGKESVYYLCPRCDITLERDYQAFCDRCGQLLDWRNSDRAKCRKDTP